MEQAIRKFVIVTIIGVIAVPMRVAATGMLPDAPLLVVSEADGLAQMGLKNTDNQPLLLYTTVVNLPGDDALHLYALPSVTRVESGARQIVRFVLENNGKQLSVQHLKRIRFEGIPSVSKVADGGSGVISLTVRQDIPAVISPRGLEQDPQPWKRLNWTLTGHTLTVSNPSPFVIRLSQQVDLMPAQRRIKLFERTFVLPGETLTLQLPADASPHAVRIFPASPFGFDVGHYDFPLEAGKPEGAHGASEASVLEGTPATK